MPATPPYALLLVVKNTHVGSSWLAALVSKQPAAAFKHEATACVRDASMIASLLAGNGCDMEAHSLSQARLGADADTPTRIKYRRIDA